MLRRVAEDGDQNSEQKFLRRVVAPGQGLYEQLGRTRDVLSGDADAAGERAMAEYAGDGEVDARILAQLGPTPLLANPEAFPAAHRRLAHALEVLDREGSRDPDVPNLWIMAPVTEFVVESVADYIKKSYLRQVGNSTRRLYNRREVASAPGSPERVMLRQARVEMDRLTAGLPASGNGLLALVAGGAVLSGLATVLRYVGALYLGNSLVLLVAAAITFVVATFVAGSLLRGASIARHRSRLIMRPALTDLWVAVGNCGDPPEDDGDLIATTAVIVTAIAWLILPVSALVVSLS